jgi:hypothetical protein
LSGIYRSKEVAKTWKMLKELVIQVVTVLLQMLETCGFWCIQTADQAHVEILEWSLEAVLSKRPDFWPNDWILHHDSASVHRALSIKQFLAQKVDYWNTHPVPLIWTRMTSGCLKK